MIQAGLSWALVYFMFAQAGCLQQGAVLVQGHARGTRNVGNVYLLAADTLANPCV